MNLNLIFLVSIVKGLSILLIFSKNFGFIDFLYSLSESFISTLYLTDGLKHHYKVSLISISVFSLILKVV